MTGLQIVAAARKYLGTPFGHQGRIAGTRLDCVGLVLCVAHDLGLLDKTGIPITRDMYAAYSAQPAGNFVYQACLRHLEYKPVQEIAPGDVAVLAIPHMPCHVAIVGDSVNQRPIYLPIASRTDALTLIHAYAGGTAECVEHRIDYRWQKRIAAAFRFPGVVE